MLLPLMLVAGIWAMTEKLPCIIITCISTSLASALISAFSIDFQSDKTLISNSQELLHHLIVASDHPSDILRQ